MSDDAGAAESAGCAEIDDAVRRELVQVAVDELRPFGRRLAGIGVEPTAIVGSAVARACGDLLALVDRDPAARGQWRYVLEAYGCFRAVLAHRLAHAVVMAGGRDEIQALTVARLISERAKVRTGVEIHPSARIGDRFVVDHGIGTVIGEDVVIGSQCYLLQGVVLGSLGIADNRSGRRHPRLGDRVQVGCFSRLLGPITIGDDVVIGSHALVRSDLASGSQVAVVHQYQIVSGGVTAMAIHGVEALGRSRYRLHGVDLDRSGIRVELLDPAGGPAAPGSLAVLRRNTSTLTVQVNQSPGRHVTHLRVSDGASAVTVGIPTARSRLRDSG